MSRMCTIAIDFGTAYSGYAYSLRVNNQNVLRVKQWERRTGADTAKTPTCILFDENQEFIGFGYKARDSYYEISKNPNTYFYFKDFKMELYNQKITKDLMIKDVNKKSMSAMKVFSAALKFLRDDALETLDKEGQNMARDLVDITWVLTVPAIWDIPARQFMREAALQAGLVSDSNEDTLVIALEPEAASIRCKQLNSGDFMTSDVAINLCPGTQYIVVDCGGGTIDITVHEVLAGGDLKELHKASGNDKGGRTVDRQFTRCLRRFFCDGLWEEYETNHPKEAQQFMEDFIFFRQSALSAHVQLFDEFKGLVQEKLIRNEVLFNEMDGMTLHLNKQANSESYSPKLEITRSKMESFFNETLLHVTDSVYEITNKLPGIKYILLVGGLFLNQAIRKHVQKEFGVRAKVLCPKKPQEAILMGAVMFGQDQSVIRSRKSAFTYGVKVVQKFDPSKHDAGKVKMLDDDRCDNIFLELVGINEDVEWNGTRDFMFYPLHKDQPSKISLYRTERKKVLYVNDWGVDSPVASCVVNVPDITKGFEHEILLEVCFGATEIKAKATDLETENAALVKMDFINK